MENVCFLFIIFDLKKTAIIELYLRLFCLFKTWHTIWLIITKYDKEHEINQITSKITNFTTYENWKAMSEFGLFSFIVVYFHFLSY